VANNADPKKVAILAVLLLVLATVVALRLRPTLIASVGASGVKLAHIGSYTVPVLEWGRTTPREVPTPHTGRNLFTFGAPPTPTPDRRPTPVPPPPPPPRPTPTPAGVYVDGRWTLPPPPPFPMSYLGWLGPDRLQVAVFREGDDVLAVPVGETVKQKFVVRAIDPAAVTIGFVGYPKDVTTRVPLAR
jgi:hypothetical protein